MARGGAMGQEVRVGFLEAAGVARETGLSTPFHSPSENLAGNTGFAFEPSQAWRSLETSR